jgi:hypothetical protein
MVAALIHVGGRAWRIEQTFFAFMRTHLKRKFVLPIYINMELDMSSHFVHGRRYTAGLRFMRCVLNAVNLKSLSLSVFGGRIPRNCATSDKKDVK